MPKKSYAEVLKENLNENSFKNSISKNRKLENNDKILNDNIKKTENNETFKLEIKQYFLTQIELDNIYGSVSFYSKLFKDPVKLIFFWCEDSWEGTLFYIYEYKNKYIYSSGGFGSCEICDNYPKTIDESMRIFNNLTIIDSLDKVKLNEYMYSQPHPELYKKFNIFKNNYINNKSCNN